MYKRFSVLVFILMLLGAKAQEAENNTLEKYLEDQFYVGLTYNFILNKPSSVKQQNLSYGLQGGFIKDIPLNKERDFALGIGLGYGVNSYYTNLQAINTSAGITYEDLDSSDSYKRNKLETHVIELPLELRWRNSTPYEHRFWRIYAGMKFGYIVGSRSKFVTDSTKDSFYNTDTRNFRYGLMLNVGYNTFNIHAYYALTDLFEDNLSLTNGEGLSFVPLRIGIIFYIL